MLALIALAAVAALLIVSALAFGQGRRNDRLAESHIARMSERLERLILDETARGREEGSAASRALREEISSQVRGFQDSTLLQIGELNSRQDQAQAELRKTVDARLTEIRSEAGKSAKDLRDEVAQTLGQLGQTLASTTKSMSDAQRERLDHIARELAGLRQKSEQLQETLRESVERRLDALRAENAAKLETIRQTVDERLQGTLETRLGESFKLVSERLELVHQGLGEMQALATGVGDLRRVLLNVKVRGTWGEVRLGALLEQMLSPEQYVENAQCRQGSLERVDYAVRLPGRGEQDPEVLLPIDATFPNEDYERLLAASEAGDKSGVEAASRHLEAHIRNTAKEIRSKYINPPLTTNFAILFLPTEGLFAEALRKPGFAEQLQREFRVSLAGPTTLGAMLNALQMGFRTLAIQKRSSDVWVLLEAVKTEFGRYGGMLDKLQRKLQEASTAVDAVSARRQAIDRKLHEVGTLPQEAAELVLGLSPLKPDGVASDKDLGS